MTYLELQQVFSQRIACLILEAKTRGYEITLGEAYRPQVIADYYAAHHCGIKNSLHTHRLAMDLNLFKSGKFLQERTDYEPLAALWKSWSTNDYRLCWGGDFHTPDSDHFSLSYEGLE